MKGWRKIGKCLLLLLLCSISWKTDYSTASAAGADVSIITDANPVVSGEIFYVMITITSSQEMSGFEGYFSYNQNVMKYITGGSVSSGNDDTFSISDTDRENGSSTLKYSIQFKARRSGSSTIELKSPYSIYSAEDSEKMSVAYDSLNIRVLSKKEAREQQQTGSGTAEPDKEEEQPEDEKKPADFAENQLEDKERPDPATSGLQTELPQGTEDVPEITTNQKEGGYDEPFDADFGEAGDDVSSLENDQPEGNLTEAGQGSGLSQTVCITVIIIAGICLILIGIVFVKMGREDKWEAGEENEYEQENIETEEVAEENIQESLAEIERRLEQKRRWLKKDR